MNHQSTIDNESSGVMQDETVLHMYCVNVVCMTTILFCGRCLSDCQAVTCGHCLGGRHGRFAGLLFFDIAHSIIEVPL